MQELQALLLPPGIGWGIRPQPGIEVAIKTSVHVDAKIEVGMHVNEEIEMGNAFELSHFAQKNLVYMIEAGGFKLYPNSRPVVAADDARREDRAGQDEYRLALHR